MVIISEHLVKTGLTSSAVGQFLPRVLDFGMGADSELLTEVVSRIEAAGLDTTVGFLTARTCLPVGSQALKTTCRDFLASSFSWRTVVAVEILAELLTPRAEEFVFWEAAVVWRRKALGRLEEMEEAP